MPSPTDILGVILAGGRSRRFGGGDKGFADLGGQPVLVHVIERFRPQVGRLILNANGDVGRFACFGLEIVADQDHPEQGPLSGVLAAIDWADRHAPNYRAVATVATDVPFLPPDLIERLDAGRGDGVAIAVSAGRRHPTIALWPISARAAVADALDRQADSASMHLPRSSMLLRSRSRCARLRGVPSTRSSTSTRRMISRPRAP